VSNESEIVVLTPEIRRSIVHANCHLIIVTPVMPACLQSDSWASLDYRWTRVYSSLFIPSARDQFLILRKASSAFAKWEVVHDQS
jgi:hypothetical protein